MASLFHGSNNVIDRIEQCVTLETERLLLRPWRAADADELYELAKDPAIGPIAGWPIHTSVEESRQIITDILSAPGTFCITLKGSDKIIGCAGLNFGQAATMELSIDEGELGYWIGKAFWGCGYATEAAKRVIEYGFTDLQLRGIWGAYYEGNDRSCNVQRKLGFRARGYKPNVYVEPLGEDRDVHLLYLERPRDLQDTALESTP